MNALEMNHLEVTFGAVQVLEDLSFSVKEGEFFSIIGPNGSGKTTLLKALAHILPIHSGEILMKGSDISSLSRKEIAKKIALVPQQEETGLLFSVEETVLMGRSPHLGMLGLESRKDYEIARQAMEFTDVLNLAERKLNEISGGERQRVIIARAICQQADIILLDEPTSALDYSHQIQIMDLMERFQSENKATIIMVSHDLNLAAMYSDRMMIVKHGQIQALGKPEEVLTKQTLLDSFDCQMHLSSNPFKSVPRILPIPKKFR